MQRPSPESSPDPVILPVNFQAPRRATLKHLGGGVYAYPRPCACGVIVQPADRRCQACNAAAPALVFWERPFLDGQQTTRKLQSRSLRHAQLEAASNRSNLALSKIGRAVDPYARADVFTVARVLEFYSAADCPQRNEQPRTGKQLSEERRSIENLSRHLGGMLWTKLTLEDLRAYHGRRLGEISRGKGHRTVDIEERCLSAAFRWAVRNQKKTGVDRNPVAHDRLLHCRAASVRHCRDVMPADAAELHALARALLGRRQSEAVGWQLLFEALIGQRTSETLRLRMDAAAPFQAGFVQGRHLYLYQSQTSKGTFPYVEIHPALQECLKEHRRWHQARFPAAPWYFPSLFGGGVNPLRPDALTHAMRRVARQLGLPARASHGLRSFYVNVLRSQGKPDAEIALRIGHKTGGRLIVQVYGEILPYKLSWTPSTGQPAWSGWVWD